MLEFSFQCNAKKKACFKKEEEEEEESMPKVNYLALLRFLKFLSTVLSSFIENTNLNDVVFFVGSAFFRMG